MIHDEHTVRRDDEEDDVRMHIVPIDVQLEAEDEVIHQAEHSTGCNPVVREHIRHHTNLVVHRCVRPDEDPELLRNRSLTSLLDERVEEQFIATCTKITSV